MGARRRQPLVAAPQPGPRSTRRCARRGGALVPASRASRSQTLLRSRAGDRRAAACTGTASTILRSSRATPASRRRCARPGSSARASMRRCCTSPGRCAPAQGEPYRVFTPFWRGCAARLDALPRPLPPPAAVAAAPRAAPSSLRARRTGPAAAHPLGRRPARAWTPGEDGALARLEAFADGAVAGYAEGRNRPDLAGHLAPLAAPALRRDRPAPVRRRGAQCRWSQRAGAQAAAESFVRELGWREFAHHLLHHFPHTPTAPLDARFDALPLGTGRGVARGLAARAHRLSRSSMPACASCGPPAGCTTACA